MQRDAVIAGGVDYGALMYGEHYDTKTDDATVAATAPAPQVSAPKVGVTAALICVVFIYCVD